MGLYRSRTKHTPKRNARRYEYLTVAFVIALASAFELVSRDSALTGATDAVLGLAVIGWGLTVLWRDS